MANGANPSHLRLRSWHRPLVPGLPSPGEARAVDAFCIKLYKLGGITPAKKIAAVAEAANIQLNCGGLAVQSQLEAAAGAHFYASTPASRMMGAA